LSGLAFKTKTGVDSDAVYRSLPHLIIPHSRQRGPLRAVG